MSAAAIFRHETLLSGDLSESCVDRSDSENNPCEEYSGSAACVGDIDASEDNDWGVLMSLARCFIQGFDSIRLKAISRINSLQRLSQGSVVQKDYPKNQ
jgi:hypothetical protein